MLLVNFRLRGFLHLSYRNQRPVKFIFYFAELHIGISNRYNNTCFGNYFLKSNIFKSILISFNCFSDYIILFNRQGTVFFDFSLTVKAVPHECVIKTGQPETQVKAENEAWFN